MQSVSGKYLQVFVSAAQSEKINISETWVCLSPTRLRCKNQSKGGELQLTIPTSCTGGGEGCAIWLTKRQTLVYDTRQLIFKFSVFSTRLFFQPVKTTELKGNEVDFYKPTTNCFFLFVKKMQVPWSGTVLVQAGTRCIARHCSIPHTALI